MTLTVLDHAPCHLGEGPTYDPVTDTAWWVDIDGRALFEHDVARTVTRRHDLPVTASAVVRIDAARQALVAEDGLYVRDIGTGGLSRLQPVEADNDRVRGNDARVHPSGALWFGTMGWGAEANAGAIWHYRSGKLTRLFGDVTIPNAICFTADGRVGYYADTASRTVYSLPLDPSDGLPAGRPSPWRDRFDGGPDGAVIDTEGCIHIALWGAGAVVRYDPSGIELGRIALPAIQPSCPAFVGRNADRLLITTARTGLEAPGPNDGLSHIAPVSVPGLGPSNLLP